jgi:hypothetical protein
MVQAAPKRWQTYLGLVAIAVGLLPFLAACGGKSASSSATEAAVVEQVEESGTARITLSARAAERLQIKTALARANGSHTVIPYSAVFYSPSGETWAYVNTKGLTFEKRAVVVDRIDGDRALLSTGPAAGTKVAAVGVTELAGAEAGIDQ